MAILGLGVVAGLLAACDTGDGKDLMPVDPADTASSTVQLDSIGGSAETLPSVSDAADSPLLSTPASAIFEVAAPWLDGAPIDSRYTCDGLDIAPAVSWGTPPPGTEEIAIVMVDESAVSNEMAFVHWVIAGISPSEITLIEGDLPERAVQAINFFGDVGYGGPCPPADDVPHNYKLTVYALNQPLGLADRTPATEFLDAIENVATGSTDLTGTFQR
jgi:Raf kinase inhibitor-like YbhB/YbcL family protein